MPYVVGVDVGSGSIRAGLVKVGEGVVVKEAKQEIEIVKGDGGIVVQKSGDIWKAVCKVVSEVVVGVGGDITGIGFDATCSLVVEAKGEAGTPVGTTSNPKEDIIMWMDHRATTEAAAINKTNHPVLEYVGGIISPEMQIPKLKWLATHKTESWWGNVQNVHCLPDWLTYKATGETTRSVCSAVCKWNYVNDDEGTAQWPMDFFDTIGLPNFVTNLFTPHKIAQIGEKIGHLTRQTLADFSLPPTASISVASSLIDAHAGGLSLCNNGEHTVGVIAGTSACFMALHPTKIALRGIWGPYKGAVLPDMWLHEGGMSAVGVLLEHVVETHPAYRGCKEREGDGLFQYLTGYFDDPLEEVVRRGLHVYPDYLGNRSPVGDQELKGVVVGLTLDVSEASLAALFCATVVSLAYGVKHVLDVLSSNGYSITSLTVAGGIARNPIFMEALSTSTSLPTHCVPGGDAMLLGTAITASTASSHYSTLVESQKAHTPARTTTHPSEQHKATHAKRYAIFLEMLKDQQKYVKMMQ